MNPYQAPFSWELIPKSVHVVQNYRIRDSEDNRIATCYSEENATFIVKMLNKAASI